jgi:hypothetical protein
MQLALLRLPIEILDDGDDVREPRSCASTDVKEQPEP